MICPNCGSNNVNVQMVSETKLTTKNKGCLWWLCIGCWWVPLKWCLFFVPALFVKIFKPKNYKTKTKHKSMCVCQSCGYHWQAAKHPKVANVPAPAPAPATATVSVNIQPGSSGELVPIRYYGKGDESKLLIGYVEARSYPDCYTITRAQYQEAVQKCQAAGYERPQFRGDKRMRLSQDLD